MKQVRLGCNALYPFDKLTDPTRFDVPAYRQALELIAEEGFHGVEYSHVRHLSEGQARELADITADLGLTPWSAHLGLYFSSAEAKPSEIVKEAVRQIEICSHLGVQRLVAHASANLDIQTPAQALDGWQAIAQPMADAAAASDAKLALEYIAQDGWDLLIELADRMSHPGLGLNIDTGHANLAEPGSMDPILRAGNRLVTTHLQDNRGDVDAHMPPGQGVIDWLATLQALDTVGYEGMLMVEISDNPLDGRELDVRAETALTGRNMTRFVQELGWKLFP